VTRTAHRPRKPPDDGLQPERTALSWSRTSFAALVNGVLLALRDVFQFTSSLRVLAIAMAALVAVLTYTVGIHRMRVLGRHPLPARITARRQIYAIGYAAIGLILITEIALLT
jgi:uncharacterized membrane protein YidH (DUF202 family)